MRGRFCRIALFALTGVLSAGVLSGCVQMTRHSNTMIFGTNTSLGIKVGAEATATPGITVGYNRQEVVIMPLIANTADNGTFQGPCPQVVTDSTAGVLELPESCRLVGNESNDKDTYSVLASFGARFGSDVDSVGRAVDGQIAQYFATGIAAQKLAENGGAATVALGSAARANANTMGTERLLALIDSPEATDRFRKNVDMITQARQIIVTKISESTDLKADLKKMDDATGGATTFSDLCPLTATAKQCADAIANAGLLGMKASNWKAAADALN